MKKALLRCIDEIPDANGLTRTQRQILKLVADGRRSFIEIFKGLDAFEEFPFLGDTACQRQLDHLVQNGFLVRRQDCYELSKERILGASYVNQTKKQLSEMTLEELWQLFPIILSDHDSKWIDYYNEEKDLLTKHFGTLLVRINHIGSTAVDGLLAKPTVDILLEVDPASSPDAVRQTAEKCGYTVMAETIAPEYRLDLCKGYTPDGFADKVFHLHIRHPGDWDEIVFRDYLRLNPSKVDEYAKLKIELQKRFKHNRDAYTEAKGDFIRACVKEARKQASINSH